MPDIKKINEFIKKFGETVVNEQKKQLSKTDSIATGKLINSVNYRFTSTIQKIVIDFVSVDYGKYVDEGRKPGSFPPISKIKEWCRVKGLPENAAINISKKIYKFGIKPKPWIKKPFDKNRQEFNVELIKLYEKEIINDVKNAIKPK